MVFASFVISDLHIKEHIRPIATLPPANPDVPYLIIAGDIGDPFSPGFLHVIDEAKRRFKRVIFVRGNHDVYNTRSLYHVDAQISKLGIDFLQNSSVVIDNVELIGTTLWSLVPVRYQNVLRTKFGYSWEITQFLHRQDRDFLEESLKRPTTAGARMVITHYPVSTDWMTESWKNSPRSANQPEGTFYRYYNTTLSHLLDKADVFICGHSHSYVNTYHSALGGREVLLYQNPVGYSDEKTNFDSKRYIEIDFERNPKAVVKTLGI